MTAFPGDSIGRAFVRIFAFFVVILVLVAALGGAARAETADEAAQALYAQAEAEDAAGHFAKALELYRAVVDRSPSFRFAPRATARADVLATHAEGDFVPFGKVERIRRDPALANDPREIDALARDADSFPEGRVRVEARMIVAEAYLGRLARPREGLVMIDRIVDDPACDPLTRRTATRRAVEVMLAANDVDAAAALVRRTHADPEVRAIVAARLRRRAAHRASLVTISVLVLLAAAAIVRARRAGEADAVRRSVRGSLATTLLFAAWIGAGGGLLASAYEEGNAKPFVAFGIACVPLLILARAWGAASGATPSRVARAARSALCAAALIAAGFLVLEYVNAEYLQGFGL